MDRRNLLKGTLALSLLPVLRSLPAFAAQASPFHRVRPGDPAWPSPAQWDALGASVGGQLSQPTALLAGCAQGPDSAACQGALKHLGNPYYIGDQAGGTQVSGWYQAWTPAPSAYAVACRSAADIVAAVNFAREHRLRLVVKGGGHSYLGTSNAPDSLLIWTHPMQAITLHDSFVAEGCATVQQPVPAVTIEAGALWMDAYNAVTTQGGRYVQGGGCATVGVAGLVQSGGFGTFSKHYGTAAGSLLQAEVVTADGRLRTVNACNDPELYWGLRGGGGGSLGVVTRLTLKTHELPELFGFAGCTVKAKSDAAFRRLLGRFVDFYAEHLFNPQWGNGITVHGDNILNIAMLSFGLDRDAAMQIWAPFFDWVAASPQDFTYLEERYTGSHPARGWWDTQGMKRDGSHAVIFDDRPGAAPTHAWWNDNQDEIGAFLHGYDSLWLPATLLQPGQRKHLSEALFAASRHMLVRLHFNKGLAGAPPEAIAAARATATNPVMLESFALALIATGGGPRYPGLPGPKPDDSAARRDAAGVDQATAALRKIAPAAGSYVSESNYFNRNWQHAYWGSNYARLKQVKKQYDPEGLFFVHHGVGSEEWSADGFTRLA